jgi:hypothetical protein
MKKIITAIVAIILLGISFYAGIFYRRATTDPKDASFYAATTVATLNMLHDGDTDKAISFLEDLLDVNTWNMGVWIKSPYTKSTHEQMQQVLQKIAVYRQTYPRQPLTLYQKENEFLVNRDTAINQTIREATLSLEQANEQ